MNATANTIKALETEAAELLRAAKYFAAANNMAEAKHYADKAHLLHLEISELEEVLAQE